MAKERYIHTKFWTDSWIQALSIEERYLYMYFLTNQYTELCGVYEISICTIENETKLKNEKILKCLENFATACKVFYFDGYVFVKNFSKHQKQNPSILTGIENSLKSLPPNIRLKVDQFTDCDSLSQLPPNININLNINKNKKEEKSAPSRMLKKDYSSYQFPDELQKVISLAKGYGCEVDFGEQGWKDFWRKFSADDVFENVAKACQWIVDNPKKADDNVLRISRLNTFMKDCEIIIPITPLKNA